LPGLRCNLAGRVEQVGEIVDGPGQPAPAPNCDGVLSPYGFQLGGLLARRPQSSSCVGQQPFGLGGGGLGQVSQLRFLRRATANASSLAAALRVQRFAFRSCARLPAARDRSRTLVWTAPPAAWIRPPVAAIRRTAFASSPESVG
jgi:hypothetical protein